MEMGRKVGVEEGAKREERGGWVEGLQGRLLKMRDGRGEEEPAEGRQR
jgi:hypothetical protein